jgi:hypothetical protein
VRGDAIVGELDATTVLRRRAGSGEEDEPGDDGNRSVPGGVRVMCG